MHVPSPQQAAFEKEAEFGTDSIVLIAVAGAGKTSTILRAAPRMKGNVIILAYNKKIADEIKAKLKRDGVDWRKVEGATTHSIGLRNYKKAYPRVIVRADKVSDICTSMCESGEIGMDLVAHTGVMLRLVSLAKSNAFGIIGDIDDASLWEDIVDHFDLFDTEQLVKKADDVIEMSIRLLKKSNNEREIIDFDDMIYLPLLFGVDFYQFDNVVMDEAQDANIIRKLLADALLKKNGRFFGVGDPRQAIYGFTGADNESMANLKEHFGCKEMPLTVTYRCPKAVVAMAKAWVKRDLITDVTAYIDSIFADNVAGILTLSTIHRSKGREWKRVYWLDRFNTCPSRYATQEWEKIQEANLQYVAATRSMGELIDLLMPLPKIVAVNDNQKPQPAVKAA